MGDTTTTLELYTGGSYLEKNPFWHIEESPWKAKQVIRLLNRQRIVPKTICEVGCGAGEVLKQLQQRLTEDCELLGCDISPQAIELCRSRANEKLHFLLGDVTKMPDKLFDLILVLDLIEHLEDSFHSYGTSGNEPTTRSLKSCWTSQCRRFCAPPR